MKKTFLNTVVIGLLIFGLVALSLARTGEKVTAADLNLKSQPTAAIEKPKWWRIKIIIIIVIERERAQISGNPRVDERGGLLFLENLKFSGAKTDVLDLNEEIALSAEDSEHLGYESIVISAGNYKITKEGSVALKFTGKKAFFQKASLSYSNKLATLKPYGKTFDVVYDEFQLRKEYEYEVAKQEKRNGLTTRSANLFVEKRRTNNKFRNFEEFKALLTEEIIQKTSEIIPNGQPQGFSIHIERWTDKDGHRHTKISFD